MFSWDSPGRTSFKELYGILQVPLPGLRSHLHLGRLQDRHRQDRSSAPADGARPDDLPRVRRHQPPDRSGYGSQLRRCAGFQLCCQSDPGHARREQSQVILGRISEGFLFWNKKDRYLKRSRFLS